MMHKGTLMGGGNFSDPNSGASSSGSGSREEDSNDRERSDEFKAGKRKSAALEVDRRSYISKSSITSIDKTNLLITAI